MSYEGEMQVDEEDVDIPLSKIKMKDPLESSEVFVKAEPPDDPPLEWDAARSDSFKVEVKFEPLDYLDENIDIEEAPSPPAEEEDEKKTKKGKGKKNKKSAKNGPEEVLSCDNCGFKTVKPHLLKLHRQKIHKEDCKYTCTECDYRTPVKCHLQSHLVGKHGSDSPFKCDLCEFSTKYSTILRRHKLRKHAESQPPEKETPTKRSARIDEDNPTGKKYSCCDCDYTTNVKSNLKTHFMGKHCDEVWYSCDECEFSSKYTRALRRHKLTKHSEAKKRASPENGDTSNNEDDQNDEDYMPSGKRFKCCDCDYATDVKSHLKTHIMGRHSNEVPYKCEICGFATKYSRALARHKILRHSAQDPSSSYEKKYHCNDCDYVTAHKNALQRHFMGKHNDEELECDFCEYKTKYTTSLRRHMMTKHEEGLAKKIGSDKTVFMCKRSDFTTYFKLMLTLLRKKGVCRAEGDECDYENERKGEMKEEEGSDDNGAEEGEFKGSPCDGRPLSASGNMPPRIRKKLTKLHKCSTCDYVTLYKNGLKIHERKHDLSKLLKCDVCDFTTAYPDTLKRHLVLTHVDDPDSENVRKYKCNMCDYFSLYPNNLKSHMRKHSTVKEYKCQFCNYETAYPSSFAKHSRVHSRQESFQCDHCAFQTKTEGRLSRHLVNAHKVPLVNKHKCLLCDFSTDTKWRLSMHEQRSLRPRPIKCLINRCNFETRYKCEINYHKSKHLELIVQSANPSSEETQQLPEQIVQQIPQIAQQLSQHIDHMSQQIPQQLLPPKPEILEHNPTNAMPEQNYSNFQFSSEMSHLFMNQSHPPHYQNLTPQYGKPEQNLIPQYGKQENLTPQYGKQEEKPHYDNHPTNVVDWKTIVVKTADTEKPFSCALCTYTAKFKALIQKHFYRHHCSKEKTHICRYCNFATATKMSLDVHIRRSTQTEEMVCQCGQFRSMYKCAYMVHQKIHYEFKCNLCEYSCKSKYDLENHTLMHAGKGYKCRFCDYQTTVKNRFITHEATHTGMKPYKCNVCDYSSARRDTLETHIKKKHLDGESNEEETGINNEVVVLVP